MNNNFNWSTIKLVNICHKVLCWVADWKLLYRRKEWRNAEGLLHREDGPAVIRANGYQEWRVDGKLHREDGGPARIWADGTQEWYVNGRLHREDGPAVIWADGTQSWYINGERHRLNGPAIIYSDGTSEWWVNHKNITNELYCWMKKNNITYPFNDESLVLFKLRFS